MSEGAQDVSEARRPSVKACDVKDMGVLERRSEELCALAVEADNAQDWSGARKLHKQSIAILRLLYAQKPEAFRAQLAKSIDRLGYTLFQLDLFAESQTSFNEAVELRRVLADLDPSIHSPLLSKSLHNLGVSLHNLGLDYEAVDHIAESIELSRELYAHDPITHRASLAGFLSTLSTYLNNVDSYAAACDAARESIELRRILHAAEPDTYTDDLAHSLYQLSISLTNGGLRPENQHSQRSREARDAALEAAELQRKLYTTNPEKYRELLADSLHCLGVNLTDLDLLEQARDSTLEASELRRMLVALDPIGHRENLAQSLYQLSRQLQRLKMYPEARDAASEAVELRRVLFAAHPDMYRARFSDCLQHFGNVLDDLGCHPEARDIAMEALELRRTLYNSEPNRYRLDLANTLYCLGIFFNKLKLHEEARNATSEAVQLRRTLYKANPTVYRHDLANTLHNLRSHFLQLKSYANVRDTTLELITIQKEISAANPNDSDPAELIDSYQRLSVSFLKLEQYPDARDAAVEATKLERLRYTSQPTAHRARWLVWSMFLLRDVLQAMGSASEREILALDQDIVLLIDQSESVLQLPNEKIGSGAFGAVYRAKWKGPSEASWDTSLTGELVVKKIKGVSLKALSGSSTLSSSHRRLYREIVISYRLSISPHTNVVYYLGYIADTDGIGLVMPYFPGGNVTEYIKATPEVDRVGLCRDIALGLRHLHRFSPPVVHGDLKPANVVVDEDGTAALCDFGLSRLRIVVAPDHHEKRDKASGKNHLSVPQPLGFSATKFYGTPLYCAPELMEADDAFPTFASDVYAFGCTCAEIVTGRRPFAQFSGPMADMMIIDALFDCLPPYGVEEITMVSPQLAILAECWDADPLKRPTMDQVCERMGWEEAESDEDE